MNQDRNPEPGNRFRSILSSQEGELDDKPQPQDQPQPQSPLTRLPHIKTPVQSDASSNSSQMSASAQGSSRPPVQAPPPAPVPVPTSPVAKPRKGLRLGPPFWTITGILSLVVNGILIAVLLVLYNMLGQIQNLQGNASNIGASVLGGMYTNFEKLDRATINTTIPVDAQIPLDLSVPVQTTTQIVLAETVTIPNAQVVINTGGLNINSSARVTLPAGTPMMVNLNFTLPVQTTIPVHLDVPVNIPMTQTELHEPFVGLQQVVRPWYCLVQPDALNLTGQAICQ